MELGMRGATQQSWYRDTSIRVYIRRLQDEHPKANPRRLTDLLIDLMRRDDNALAAAAEYAVKNAINAQDGYDRRVQVNGNGNHAESAPRTIRPQPTHEERERAKAEITKAANEGIAKILLLNQEMPNGKRLRYCTGAEVAKFGQGYARIAKKVGSTKLVGSVLNEAEVRKLME